MALTTAETARQPQRLKSAYTVGQRASIIAGLIVRQFKGHMAGSRLGLLFTIADIIAHIVILGFLFSLIGRTPKFGDSAIIFLATGLIPFKMAIYLANAVPQQLRTGRAQTRLPVVNEMGLIFAAVAVNFINMLIACIVICVGADLIGVTHPYPDLLHITILAMLLAVVFGTGVGLINGVIGMFAPWYLALFDILTKGLFLISGIFFVVDYLPPQIRDVLSWNPIAHLVIAFRMGFFDNYPTMVFDAYYVGGWSLGVLTVGVIMHRMMRRQY